MKEIIVVSLLLSTFAGYTQNQVSLKEVPASVTLFAEGLVSTKLNERDFALSPAGDEIFYTISTPKSTFQTIVQLRKQQDGSWTKPEVASFARQFSDLEPAYSADGNTLYFSSNRPVIGDHPKDFDIWKVNRISTGWSAPINLGSVINSNTDEFYPSVARNGNLYFTASYKAGPGREDIYVAAMQAGQYQKPIPLDSGVNTIFYEFNAFVDPDEKFIIFTSYGRKDDSGGGDLYISLKESNGTWKPAINLHVLNSKQLDYCPFVTSDGATMFFTSDRHNLPTSFQQGNATIDKIQDIYDSILNGNGNIYWMDFKNLISTIK